MTFLLLRGGAPAIIHKWKKKINMGTRVYIGRLSYHAREKDVERFFRGFGRIRDIMLKNGYGFVEFEDYRDADDAVYELNGKELCGERVIVEHARGLPRSEESWRDRDRGSRFPPRRRGGRDKYGPPTRTEFRLIVENLSSRVSWQLVQMTADETLFGLNWPVLNECVRAVVSKQSDVTGVALKFWLAGGLPF
ncbi:SFRS4_5_6 [Acanthosepion pharaonis]|uniref:SFRS4_5_6 n=1 Tax=Acanthosepion pharaonis TaxID=158019 RepID=A0A812EIC7_ACAPH|nr:SFRS4_5_6 [Sepia pharaonis]